MSGWRQLPWPADDNYLGRFDAIANVNWLRPGSLSRNQQQFGAQQLDLHPLLVVLSVVSSNAWNLLIDVNTAAGFFDEASSEVFALDTRLASP